MSTLLILPAYIFAAVAMARAESGWLRFVGVMGAVFGVWVASTPSANDALITLLFVLLAAPPTALGRAGHVAEAAVGFAIHAGATAVAPEETPEGVGVALAAAGGAGSLAGPDGADLVPEGVGPEGLVGSANELHGLARQAAAFAVPAEQADVHGVGDDDPDGRAGEGQTLGVAVAGPVEVGATVAPSGDRSAELPPNEKTATFGGVTRCSAPPCVSIATRVRSLAKVGGWS